MEHYLNLSINNIHGEIWKDIKGYEGLYQVSNMGRIKSFNYLNKGKIRILKQYKSKTGYLTVSLCKDNKNSTKRVHRLVALAFIPNLYNKDSIDHLDTDRTNNVVDNLRWCTAEENVNNPLTINNLKNNAKINIIKAYNSCKKSVRCKTTNEIFNSVKEAAEYYGIDDTNICRVCNGKRKTCGKLPNGLRLEWEYVEK